MRYPRVVRRRGRTPTVLAALAFSWLAATAHAQDPSLDRAATLLKSQDAAGAYALLDTEEARRAGEPRFDYLFGIAALDSGHVTRAIFALERAVASQPENGLARAELARAYLAAGETERARVELERARRSPMPGDAAAAIDRVLGVVDQVAPRTGPRFSGYLEFGGGYDTNVNSAANQGDFAIPAFGGLLFETAQESQKQHDLFATAAGGANAQFTLAPGWKALVATSLRANLNRRVHDMNTDLFDVTAGVNHQAGLQSQTVALQNGTAWVGSRAYRTANGATAQWQSQLDAVSQASVFAQWSRQEYADQAPRNTDRSVLGLGFARDFGASVALVYGSAYYAQERVRQDGFEYFGHHATGLRLGAEHRFSDALAMSVDWQHETRRYGAAEPLFDVQRRDRQDDLSLQMRYAVRDGWQLIPLVRYTRAASNVVLYDFTRTVFQLTLRKEFP